KNWENIWIAYSYRYDSMMLDIGCGEGPKRGDIGLDIRKTSSVDILADARMLPFRDESFVHVYSSHLIEHF
ncbi:hypothetical protein KEJ34_08855, partial [Candidatus Bathyarchaeota archaeon]|nr:hypothetical protein [Candidatus Bathyarchaeota archaeon]